MGAADSRGGIACAEAMIPDATGADDLEPWATLVAIFDATFKLEVIVKEPRRDPPSCACCGRDVEWRVWVAKAAPLSSAG